MGTADHPTLLRQYLLLHPPPFETQTLALRLVSSQNPSLKAKILTSRPKSQPQGQNPCLRTQSPILRPKSQPPTQNPLHKAQSLTLRPKSPRLREPNSSPMNLFPATKLSDPITNFVVYGISGTYNQVDYN